MRTTLAALCVLVALPAAAAPKKDWKKIIKAESAGDCTTVLAYDASSFPAGNTDEALLDAASAYMSCVRRGVRGVPSVAIVGAVIAKAEAVATALPDDPRADEIREQFALATAIGVQDHIGASSEDAELRADLVRIVERAEGISPDSPSVWLMKVQLLQRGEFGAHEAYTRTVIERFAANPSDEGARSVAAACMAAGARAADNPTIAPTVAWCREAIEGQREALSDEAFTRALSQAVAAEATAIERSGGDALMVLQRLVTLTPNAPSAHVRLALATVDRDPDAAIPLLQDIIERWPNNIEAHFSLGSLFVNEAVAAQQEQAGMDPGDPAYAAVEADLRTLMTRARPHLEAVADSTASDGVREVALGALVNALLLLGQDEDAMRRMTEHKALRKALYER